MPFLQPPHIPAYVIDLVVVRIYVGTRDAVEVLPKEGLEAAQRLQAEAWCRAIVNLLAAELSLRIASATSVVRVLSGSGEGSELRLLPAAQTGLVALMDEEPWRRLPRRDG